MTIEVFEIILLLCCVQSSRLMYSFMNWIKNSNKNGEDFSKYL